MNPPLKPAFYLLTALFVAGAVSCCASARESEEQTVTQLAPTKGASEVALTCSILRAGPIGPRLRIEGACSFPEKTILKISAARGSEVEKGGRLELEQVHAGESLVEVLSNKFETEILVDRSGVIRLSVILEVDYQRQEVAEKLRGKFPIRRWEFEYSLWSDELLEQLRPYHAELESIAKQMALLLGRAEAACASRELWERRSPEIREDAGKFVAQIERARWAQFFPAATEHLEGAWLWLRHHSDHFFWKPDGMFGGAFNVDEGKWVKTAWGLPFTFEGMRDDLKFAVQVAEREFGLWIIKDVRRAGRRDALMALASEGPLPVPSFVERLKAGEELAKLEVEIRGKQREMASGREPPPPDQFRDIIAARRRFEEAAQLLDRADRLWSEPESFAIYKRLLKEYPDALEKLRARGRVERRAQQED